MQKVDQIILDDSALSKTNEFSIEQIQLSTNRTLVKLDDSLLQLDYGRSFLQHKDRAYYQKMSSNISDQQTNQCANYTTESQEFNQSNSYQDEPNNSEQKDNSTIYNIDEYKKKAQDKLKLIQEYLSVNDPLAISNDTEKQSTKKRKISVQINLFVYLFFYFVFSRVFLFLLNKNKYLFIYSNANIY
ncbi:transmembrane protein, putative (macronuclear) [Tetrahymena thermophila SB210]|uniref:Transmembrane protein, putative n=1 Tax=Tetrahymena thermophila (strain SB210) TaxID=312017 RepID=W7WZ12_TETTS|nr:transmembrane protein, putative [Tetrahymena thermophila SB210]EWS72155.1 transmembrane protein, putative [Tetrahymena thermophila SB210]|eukprot:XP_012655317.1 transmembrane protein, putative [Tetrahymena thermophila SB210]